MKIISKYYDYYDCMSHVYGEDPLLRYERETLNGDLRNTVVLNEFNKRIPFQCYNNYRALPTDPDFYEVLFFCGVAYRVERYVKPGSPDRLRVTVPNMHRSRSNVDLFTFQEYGKEHPAAIAVNKLFGNPVVLVTHTRVLDRNGTAFQAKKDFLLKETNFPDLVPADQAYQRISQFLASMKEEAVPEKISDVQRAANHGFNKHSFRGK